MCDLTGSGQWSSYTVSAQPHSSPRRPVSNCTQGRSYIRCTVNPSLSNRQKLYATEHRELIDASLHLYTAAATRHISVRIPLHRSEILALDTIICANMCKLTFVPPPEAYHRRPLALRDSISAPDTTNSTKQRLAFRSIANGRSSRLKCKGRALTHKGFLFQSLSSGAVSGERGHCEYRRPDPRGSGSGLRD